MTQISFLSLKFIQIFVQPRSWFNIEVICWNWGLNSWDPFVCRIILPLWVVVGQCCWFKHSRWFQFNTESVGLDVAFPDIWIASHENQNSLKSRNMWMIFFMVYLKSMKTNQGLRHFDSLALVHPNLALYAIQKQKRGTQIRPL